MDLGVGADNGAVKVGYVVVAVVCGGLLAVQGWVNGQLGAGLGDGVAAAAISTLGGLVVLGVVLPLTSSGRRGIARFRDGLRTRELLWWQCLGGVCGALFIAGQGIAVSTLGVALFTVAAVTGQLLSGLLVDRAGIGPGGQQAITGWRILGAAIAVVAVVVSLNGDIGAAGKVWLVILPAVAGFGLAWQSAMNGLVRQTAGNSFLAALVNFGVAMATLLVAFVVDLAIRGWPTRAPSEWWLYTGGLYGIFVISGGVLVVKAIGVLLLSLCTVAGQLGGAVLLDLVVPARGTELTVASVLGTVITLVAVVVAAIPERSERMTA
ncbi:DMT family transporter [Actinocrispum sp. NPDC049592]|uniref:DMT family transporter n=1 Tax=Actinocrispum sp. NPDC049592 TaxID=3154835 RepID=UPI003429765F